MEDLGRFVKVLEDSCINHNMIRLSLYSDIIESIEYYLYIEEMEIFEQNIQIRSGNFEMSMVLSDTLNYDNNIFIFNVNNIVCEFEIII